jgi:hypothetical protein
LNVYNGHKWGQGKVISSLLSLIRQRFTQAGALVRSSTLCCDHYTQSTLLRSRYEFDCNDARVCLTSRRTAASQTTHPTVFTEQDHWDSRSLHIRSGLSRRTAQMQPRPRLTIPPRSLPNRNHSNPVVLRSDRSSEDSQHSDSRRGGQFCCCATSAHVEFVGYQATAF